MHNQINKFDIFISIFFWSQKKSKKKKKVISNINSNFLERGEEEEKLRTVRNRNANLFVRILFIYGNRTVKLIMYGV